MPQHFLDSSALLKRYRNETGSQWMLDLSLASDRLVVARLAHVEVTSAIVRRGREPGNTAEQVAVALATLDREVGEIFEVIELEGPVISRAIQLARAHALRPPMPSSSPVHCYRVPSCLRQRSFGLFPLTRNSTPQR